MHRYKVKPAKTDHSITKYNSKHNVFFDNSVPSKGKLLIFFPGTAAPTNYYSKILSHAAKEGYHVIGLTYPNNYDIYISCFFNKYSSCYEEYRLEKFDGSGKPNLLFINYANSIQNRLIKLLTYLDKKYPEQNWGHYIESDDIAWSKTVLAGHSQGGGHAAFISKMKSVDRVIIFSSIDWIIATKSSAAWVSKEGKTPNDKVYAFIHTKDEIFKYPNVKKQWLDYKLDSLGNIVNIDKTLPPYNNAHTLITTTKPALHIPISYHSLTCVNQFVPQNRKGEVDKNIKAAWSYLLGE